MSACSRGRTRRDTQHSLHPIRGKGRHLQRRRLLWRARNSSGRRCFSCTFSREQKTDILLCLDPLLRAFSVGATPAVTNESGSKVIITGNATGTFFNAVTNDAASEFRVSTGAAAAFFSNVNGSGAFTGGGVKIFEGGTTSAVAAIATEGGDTIISPSV